MSTRIPTVWFRPARPDPQVVEWRRSRLRAAGFAPALAEKAALEPRLDLHAVIERVERGCEPALAVRILAPIDEPEVIWDDHDGNACLTD